MPHLLGRQADRPAPLRHLRVGESQPSVGVFLAQHLLVMWPEIDDIEPPTGAQHPRHLGQHRGRLFGVVQDLMDHRRVERPVGERQLIHVGLADQAVSEVGAVEAGARDGQHLARQIDADGALRPLAQKPQHASGAGADVEQVADAGLRHHRQERSLDFAIVDMQRADLVPLRGVGAEIGGGGLGAGAAHPLEAVQVAGHRRFVGRDEVDQRAHQPAAAAALGQSKERPGAFAETLHEAGVAQQPQMPGYPRLALAENLGKLADRELAPGAQDQDAHPGRFGHGAQRRQRRFHAGPPASPTTIITSIIT